MLSRKNLVPLVFYPSSSYWSYSLTYLYRQLEGKTAVYILLALLYPCKLLFLELTSHKKTKTVSLQSLTNGRWGETVVVGEQKVLVVVTTGVCHSSPVSKIYFFFCCWFSYLLIVQYGPIHHHQTDLSEE